MKTGKVSESILKRSVLKLLGTKSKKILQPAGVGEDCGAVEWPDNSILLAATDPGTLGIRGELAVRTAVVNSLNNLACSGGKAVSLQVCILLPIETEEAELKQIIKELALVCEEEQVVISGGHTEVTSAVTRPVITVTALGCGQRERVEAGKKAGPGMDIIVTKGIGLAGTVLLAEERKEELLTRYPLRLIEQAQSYVKDLSVQKEAECVWQNVVERKASAALHDLSQGGVFGGLWELSQRIGVGLDVDLKKIPIRQETVEICEFFGLNPYELQSQGSLLLFAEDGNEILRQLEQQGIMGTIIGKTTAGNDRILRNEEEERFLEPSKPDEIIKILG